MAVGIQAGSANNRQAHLANAYQELGNELSSTNCKVVGGYTLGRVIGEVFLATHRLTGTRCAVKRIPKSHTSQVTREIHHHRRLHHLHIVQLYEIIATETHVWLVTELCSGGELFDYLLEKGRMLEGEARRLFGELAVAVGHMHKEGVVHRDLKLENVLLDGELRIKLGDLGFAREWAKGKLRTFCGTTGYASPEMLSGKKYLGVETDLWSMGIILYILLCGGLPFDDDDERVMKDLILAGTYDEPEWLSEHLISQLLRQDPQARLSIEGILTHPWFSMTITDVPPQQPLSVPSSPQPDAGPGNGILVSPGLATADIKRIHSGEFSHTEKALEAMHDRSISFAPTTTSDDSNSLQLPLASSSRTPSRTKRRSVSSTMSLERRASTHAGTTYLPVDYAAMLKEERTALFTTKEEKKLLDRLAAVYVDTGQLIHSVETHACDSSSAMWWLLRAKQMDEVDTAPRRRETRRREDQFSDKSREQSEPTARSETLPLAQPAPRHHLSPGIEPQISRGPSPTEIRPTDITPKAKPAALTIPIATPRETPSTPTREPNTISLDGSPKHGLKTRSPSMSMLQRATSAFLGKSADDETGHSPTKLQKAPPLPTVNLAERPLDRNKDEKKRESMWTSWSSFRQFFNDGNYRKKRPDMALSSRDKPTLVLSRGIAARAPHGRRVPSGQVAAARRTSVDRPVYSRRSSSVNSRRSSISMVEPVRLTGADGIPLYRRTSHRSHGSQTPTSDREFDFPSRPDSATSLRRRDSQRSGISAMRSPSMQSDSSFNRRVPISPLHNYQRRPPQGTASTRIRHIRVIPESQLLRSNSVASSIRSNPSSRASSIHEDDESVHNLSSGSGGHTHHAHNRRRKDSESLARQIHRRGSPLVPHTYGSSANPHSYRSKPRKPKTHLRDVFQKDDEWIDEDQYRYAGGLGQGGSNGTAPRADTLGGSMASSAWIDGRRTALNTLGAKRHKSGSAAHAHATAPTLGQPVGRKSSGSDSSPDSTTQVSSNVSVGTSGNQRRGIPTGRAQPAIIQEEEEEEE